MLKVKVLVFRIVKPLIFIHLIMHIVVEFCLVKLIWLVILGWLLVVGLLC